MKFKIGDRVKINWKNLPCEGITFFGNQRTVDKLKSSIGVIESFMIYWYVKFPNHESLVPLASSEILLAKPKEPLTYKRAIEILNAKL